MRLCHACQRELNTASLATGKCVHCGAVIRNLSQRTFENKVKPDDNEDSKTLDPHATDPSIELPSGPFATPRATLNIGDSDTAGEMKPATPAEPVANDPNRTSDFGLVDDPGKTSDSGLVYDPGKTSDSGLVSDPNKTSDSGLVSDPNKTSDANLLSDTERKAPTLGDQGDFTMALPLTGVDPTFVPSKPPGRRSTHTIEGDRTIDLDASSADAKKIESQWKGTFDKGSRQGQTIRQKDTVTGFRSSLPVKSRYVRERPRDGRGRPPVSPAETPDYELLDILGEGGMGVVYSAHQSSIARTVAVKMLKPQAKIRDEQRDKFISEAVVTGELDHPNIVPIYDLGANEQGALFYSMKKVKGTPWDKVVNQKQLDDNLDILLRVGDAVAFAHDRGVIHRDLKPENVMLGDYGEVLVMDWGLARISPEFVHKDAVFQVDSLGGTPAYMAPEMARGPIDIINKTSDIYLLGAILYEIIGGQPPHSGRDVMQCLMAASQNRIDAIRYEGELKDIALKAMSTKQTDRYANVKEFQEAVRLYQSHSESLVLTAHAGQNLRKAREENDIRIKYQLYNRALYGFQESLTLWPENTRAKAQLVETQSDYAKVALANGDLDLAGTLLDKAEPEHQAIQTQIDAARRERIARARRFFLAKLAVAGLIAGIVATVTIAYFQVSKARDAAVVARDDAVEAQKAEALARKDAVIQRDAATEAQKLEAAARKDAVIQRDAATEAQKLEAEARKVADQKKLEAIEAKQREEYEAYVAGIGLAAAKINDNAYTYAEQLLQDIIPKTRDELDRRDWEWGRLLHLTKLSAGEYPASNPVDAVVYSPDGAWFASGDRKGNITVRDARTGNTRFDPVNPASRAEYVHSLAWSPDGRQIAVGSSNGSIYVLDATNGKTLQTLPGHEQGALTVRFSPDGKQLLSGGYDNAARLWNLADGQPAQTLKGHSWWVWAAEFSPDARRIVTAGQDGKAIVWQKGGRNPQSQQAAARNAGQTNPSPSPAVNTLPYEQILTFTGHDGPVYSASFSPNGDLIATGGADKMVMIWNPDEVKDVDIKERIDDKKEDKPNYLRLAGHDNPVRSVAFSPNGKLIVSGSEDNAIRLWDVAGGEHVKSLRGHGQAVRSCIFSPDGNMILSGSEDATVRLWNIAGYEEVRVLHTTVFKGHGDAVLSARYSKNGKQVVTASRDRSAVLWDVESGKQLQRFEEGHEFLATHAAFFPNRGERQLLATGAGDLSVRIWDLATGTEVNALAPTGRLGAVAISPDGKWVATGAPADVSPNGKLLESYELLVWEPLKNTDGPKTTAASPVRRFKGHETEVSAIAFSPVSDRMASGDERGIIRIWRTSGAPDQWTFEREFLGHHGLISELRFSSDGSRLISASEDKTCAQWDVATGTEDRDRVLKHPDWVTSLDLSPDGTLAATTCEDGFARLWRIADARELASVKAPEPPKPAIASAETDAKDGLRRPVPRFSAVSFTPDGRAAMLAAPDTERVVRWTLPVPPPNGEPVADTSSLETVLDFAATGDLVWSVMHEPSTNNILTVGGNDAQVWNTETRRPIVRLSPNGAVASADISPDGNLVATGSWDGSAKIWDAKTGRALRKLDNERHRKVDSGDSESDGHVAYVTSVEFSPNGEELLTGSDDGTARLWEVATGRLKENIEFRSKNRARVLSATYSPDGERILTAFADATAQIWDRTGKEVCRPLVGHKWAVLCGRFSPDGKYVITGSEDADTGAIIWDATTGDRLTVLAGHTAAVTSVAFSPDGTRVMTGSRDNSAKLWDPATGKEILSLPGHTQEVTAVGFAPKPGLDVLTASRDGKAIIWLAEDWHTEPEQKQEVSEPPSTRSAHHVPSRR